MICQQAKILVQHSEFRYIAACNCCGGIVHISWDAATIHLYSEAFHQFKWTLGNKINYPTEGLTQTVWLGTVGLRLSPCDYKTLSDLVQTASLKLRTLPLIAQTKEMLKGKALN